MQHVISQKKKKGHSACEDSYAGDVEKFEWDLVQYNK